MRDTVPIILLLFFIATLAAGQQPAVRSGQAAELTAESVISMVQAGISDELIIAKLRKAGQALDLSPEDLIRLKKANVSDPVLRVMLDPSTAPAVSGAAGAAGLPWGSPPSGATPTAGTNSGGDPDNPMAPHDSGIYLYAQDREGKRRLIALERAAYQGAKTGGVFTSAMTYGIKKAKTKAIIPGPRAGIRISDTAPEFYFYFDDKAAGLGKSYFGIANLSNPNQFTLLRLESRKANRETTIGEFSAFSSSSGSDAKSMIAFRSERVRAGLYRVKVENLQAGEYCFLASAGGLGAYGAGAAGAADIFDFGVGLN